MKENVDKLDIYNNSAIILDRKTPKGIISWLTILIIFFAIFIVFSFIPFNVYKSYVGYVNIDLNISVKLGYSDFPILKNKKLYIKGKEYKYEIVSIEDDVLTLQLDLDDSLKLQNNVMLINVLIDRTTLFKMSVKKIKERIG